MDILNEHLQNFILEYCEYLSPTVTVIRQDPVANEFLSHYVATSTPFVIKRFRSAALPFEAMKLWKDEEYLKTTMGTRKVTVNVKPPDQADSIVNDLFMLPEERSMDYTELADKFKHGVLIGVFYVQKENNLIEEFSPLIPDVKTDVPWATEAFDSPPVAANIYIGNEQSYVPMHKNNYENIYYVIVGCQRFELFPPIASSWMPYKEYKRYQWYNDAQVWKMKDLNEEIKWIPKDRRPETRKKYLMYSKTKSYYVDVHAGETLYIPSLWFHDIHQSHFCMAVSYRYEMKYHVKLPLFRFYDELCKLPKPSTDAAVGRQSELEENLRLELIADYNERHNLL